MEMLIEQFKVLFDRPEKVKKLRELILQLAVRGKLVEQDENDEPASVLLENIKEEKEKLIKEGKIKKEKQLPEIKEDEKPYELPMGWVWVRLGDIVQNIKGVTFKKDDAVVEEKNNYDLILRGGNIDSTSGKLIYTDNIYIPKGIVKNEQFICKGDTIMVASSGTKSSIAKSSYIENNISNTSIGAFLFIIRPYKDINCRYVNLLIRNFRQDIIDTTAGTNISNVNRSSLDLLLVPLPSINEQSRIEEKINFLMAFCDKLENELEIKVKYSSLCSRSIFNSISNCSSSAKLEEVLRFIIKNFKDLTLGDGAVKELKNAILQLAVQGKLVPQDLKDEPATVLLEKVKEDKERLISEGKIKKEKPLPEIRVDEKPYELPKGWEWVRLGEITNYGCNNSVSPDHINENEWVLELEDIEKDTSKIIQKIYNKERQSKSNKNRFFIGDVLYGKLRPYLRKVVVAPDDGVCSTEIIPFRGYCDIDSRYLMYYMKSPFIDKIVNEMTHGMNMPRLGTNQAVKIVVSLPPLNEQKRIVEKVDSLMYLCDELEKRIEKSKKCSEKLLEALLKESFKA